MPATEHSLSHQSLNEHSLTGLPTTGHFLTQDASSVEPRWYAVYTGARHEKSVASQMQERHIRYFLPLYRSVHRWKDRKKLVELALFPSYLFAHVSINRRVRVLEIPGVVHIVSAKGSPIPICEREIEALRRGADGGVRMEPHPFLREGRRVRVRSGPMTGAEGVIVRSKDRNVDRSGDRNDHPKKEPNNDNLRLVITMEILMRSVAVEIDEADVEAI
jgi:transcription antitermination factor NusG